MNDTLQAPADAPPPKKRKAGILIALVLAIVVVVGLWLAWRTPAEQLQGMADADTVNVAAKITARLAELKVREGDRVTAGQVLFVLDSPEVAAKEQQAQGAQRGHPCCAGQLETRRGGCHPGRCHLSARAEPVQRRRDDAAET